MKYCAKYGHLVFGTLVILFLASCNGSVKNNDIKVANSLKELQEKLPDGIKDAIFLASNNNGYIQDSIRLDKIEVVKYFYEKNNNEPFWSKEGDWNKVGYSLLDFIKQSRLNGLFPEDYQEQKLSDINSLFLQDSLKKTSRRSVVLWTTADLLMTNTFIKVVNDVKVGHLPNDSVSLRKDSILTDDFIYAQMTDLQQSGSMNDVVKKIEPHHPSYYLLKRSIKNFLDNATFKEYTKVPTPGKNKSTFEKALQKRLYEGGFLETDSIQLDSTQIAAAVKKFQQKKGITVDGKVGEGTLRMLNLSDREKFVRIALSLDKYKLLPQEMPQKYIWVNLPSYQLQYYVNDTVHLLSKVICGKPYTRTPLLNSQISELITYPQWVPPPSIVQKEILPAVRKNPGYLARKGFSLIDSKGNEIDPYSIDWTKYSKSVPFRIVQGSGDANSLGVMKFVFPNKYSVYLHDTNQRSLFSLPSRSLSHGCVRVQEWNTLANYIISEDKQNGGKAKADSINAWLAKKQKMSVPLQRKIPVFIRYITCEGSPKGVQFYDDIYGEDKLLAEKYFKNKY